MSRSADPMETTSFAELLEDRVSQMGAALDLVEQHAGSANLSALRMLLADVLTLVEDDPGLTAASADLLQVAGAYATAVADVSHADQLVDQELLLREAFARYRDRLAAARPSALARTAGLP